MASDLRASQLFTWLQKKRPDLSGRILEIRQEVGRWLPYVITLFPHYPEHGIEHSDRIVGQLSRLLFVNKRMTVDLSTSEVYCLLCAAYLHDSGMVVSPGDISAILATDKWSRFVETSRADTYRAIQLASKGSDLEVFAAGVALRQLIAEFVRRRHHERVTAVLEMHPFLERLVNFGDSVVLETVADVCVGHGLDESGLSDNQRYPERRTVLGEEVNVRFISRLLRIGDLLELDGLRAAPMSKRAVAPLPLSAAPHWKQYSSKKHELVAADKIEFKFECKDQETHRVLRDWMGMLEAEVRATGLQQIHSARHSDWKAPRCFVASPNKRSPTESQSGATILIRPAQGADYEFHDWKLQIDNEKILERLIFDVYDSPLAFVRELLQNALDASRCQMYSEAAANKPRPESPTAFSARTRRAFPIRIGLDNKQVAASIDSEPEMRQVLTIEDCGIGMDLDTIKNYFLQIGRSFYQSEEFRERYSFAPTSRFGIGFLSVFAVSDDITVETSRAPEGETESHPGIQMRLRGPKAYLLTSAWLPFPDRVRRDRHGTRIEVVLNRPIDPDILIRVLEQWCVRVEFPVIVTTPGRRTTIAAMHWTDQTIIRQGRVNPEAVFRQRVFPISTGGFEGQLGIVAYEDDHGEAWCDCWPSKVGLDGKRIERAPVAFGTRTALHGIALRGSSGASGTGALWHWVIDIRSPHFSISLSRENARSGEQDQEVRRAIEETCEPVVADHLRTSRRAKAHDGFVYKGKVISEAPASESWKDGFPGTIRGWLNGRPVLCSAAELLKFDSIALTYWESRRALIGPEATSPPSFDPEAAPSDVLCFSTGEIPEFAKKRLQNRLATLNLISVKNIGRTWFIVFSNQPSAMPRAMPGSAWWLTDLGPEFEAASVVSPGFGDEHWALLNTRSPVVQLLLSLRGKTFNQSGLIDGAMNRAWTTVAESPWKWHDLAKSWRASSDLLDDLKISRDDFISWVDLKWFKSLSPSAKSTARARKPRT